MKKYKSKIGKTPFVIVATIFIGILNALIIKIKQFYLIARYILSGSFFVYL